MRPSSAHACAYICAPVCMCMQVCVYANSIWQAQGTASSARRASRTYMHSLICQSAKHEFRAALEASGTGMWLQEGVSYRLTEAAACNVGPQVYLDGEKLPVKTFPEYVEMYLPDKTVPRIHEKFSDRWEVCVTPSDGQFHQVGMCMCVWCGGGLRCANGERAEVCAWRRKPWGEAACVWLSAASLCMHW